MARYREIPNWSLANPTWSLENPKGDWRSSVSLVKWRKGVPQDEPIDLGRVTPETKLARVRKAAEERAFVDFYEKAFKIIKSSWNRYFIASNNLYWLNDLTEGDKNDFAAKTLDYLVDFIRNQLKEPFPETKADTLRRYLQDPRYVSTNEAGVTFPYREKDIYGREKDLVVRPIWTRMQEEFQDMSLGQRTPLKRETPSTPDAPGMSLDDFLSSFTVTQGVEVFEPRAYEEHYITTLIEPEEVLVDHQDLDGELVLWLDPNNYTISEQELAWFRKEKDPTLTEAKLALLRRTYAEYLTLHTVVPVKGEARLSYLHMPDSELTQTQRQLKSFFNRVLRTDVDPKWLFELVPTEKLSIPANLFNVLLSEHVARRATRRRPDEPYKRVEWFNQKKNDLRIPLQMYDMLMHPGHNAKSRLACTKCTPQQLCSLHQCPTCARIGKIFARPADAVQRTIDAALLHVQLEKQWLLDRHEWMWEYQQDQGQALENPRRRSRRNRRQYAKASIR